MRISDWSSDVCSSDLELARSGARDRARPIIGPGARADDRRIAHPAPALAGDAPGRGRCRHMAVRVARHRADGAVFHVDVERARSEEHTSELQSLMRNSYAVFCLNNKTTTTTMHKHNNDRQKK